MQPVTFASPVDRGEALAAVDVAMLNATSPPPQLCSASTPKAYLFTKVLVLRPKREAPAAIDVAAQPHATAPLPRHTEGSSMYSVSDIESAASLFIQTFFPCRQAKCLQRQLHECVSDIKSVAELGEKIIMLPAERRGAHSRRRGGAGARDSAATALHGGQPR